MYYQCTGVCTIYVQVYVLSMCWCNELDGDSVLYMYMCILYVLSMCWGNELDGDSVL